MRTPAGPRAPGRGTIGPGRRAFWMNCGSDVPGASRAAGAPLRCSWPADPGEHGDRVVGGPVACRAAEEPRGVVIAGAAPQRRGYRSKGTGHAPYSRASCGASSGRACALSKPPTPPATELSTAPMIRFDRSCVRIEPTHAPMESHVATSAVGKSDRSLTANVKTRHDRRP